MSVSILLLFRSHTCSAALASFSFRPSASWISIGCLGQRRRKVSIQLRSMSRASRDKVDDGKRKRIDYSLEVTEDDTQRCGEWSRSQDPFLPNYDGEELLMDEDELSDVSNDRY